MPDIKEETYELIPSARRLIKSLRDVGYDFSTAVADLIDNSIEAGATKVDILVEFNSDETYVRIADNGKGMCGDELKEAMRFGSEREYQEEDLGKFGLGLKTASISQCQLLSVASRDSENKISSLCWDLSHIEETNRWEVLPPTGKAVISLLNQPLEEHIGTVVLWQKLDRMLGFKHPYGESARKKFISMCRELEEYLAMVFHKFLSKETSRQPLEIYLNWNKIEPWDPFARKEPNTKILSPIKIKLNHEGVSGKVFLQPYILPTKEEFSSPEAFRRASGLANWNQQQGFYIYRADRMIQSGGWCGLRTRDEHTKLSRIELNFSPFLDNAFKINVAKMRVQLPLEIRDNVDKAISPAIKLARDYYDGKKKSSPSKNADQSNIVIPVVIPSGNYSPPNQPSFNTTYSEKKLFTLDEIEQKAYELATDQERIILKSVFGKLRENLFREKK